MITFCVSPELSRFTVSERLVVFEFGRMTIRYLYRDNVPARFHGLLLSYSESQNGSPE